MTEQADLHGHVPEDLYASWSPALSPDATRVAFVSDRGGQPQVWLRALSGGPVTPVPLDGRRVHAVTWSPTGEFLACTVAPAGRSRLQTWLVRPDGRDLRLVGGADQGTAVPAQGRSGGWTAEGCLVLTETTDTSRVLRVDPHSGARTRLAEGELTSAVDISADGRCLLLVRGPRGARELLTCDVSSGATRAVVPPSPLGSSDAGCLAPDGGTVLARSDAHSDLARLVTLGGPGAARDDAELEDVTLSGDGRTAALTWNVDGGLSALTLLDLATGRQREVTPLPRRVVSQCRLSYDGKVLVLTAEGPSDPRGVWCTTDVDVARMTAVSSPGRGSLHGSRGASYAELDPAEVVTPELRRLPSADGLEVNGWLYRPPGEGPVPTLVWLHGGPEAQERPAYSSLFQSLLAEGVAVFAANVRGSTGFGRAFRTADDLAGRYGAFEDVAACARSLVDTGVAAPGRLALAGRSYGGYLTLAVLTRFPELFSVGVDVCGMSDLLTFYADTEPWIAAAAVGKYGHPVHDADLLRELSPLHAVDRLRAPLLLVHGADDTNVPVGESRQVAHALAARGVPHRLLVFQGEGHELLSTRTRVAFVQATVQWVLEHL